MRRCMKIHNATHADTDDYRVRVRFERHSIVGHRRARGEQVYDLSAPATLLYAKTMAVAEEAGGKPAGSLNRIPIGCSVSLTARPGQVPGAMLVGTPKDGQFPISPSFA